VTNIGQAHLEGFGGIDGVKRGKGELYDFLAKNGGVGFYNTDEPYLDKLAQKVPIHVSYGTKSTEVSHILVEAVSDTEKVVAKVPQSGWEYRVFAQISGDHNFENVKTAIAIGKYFKVPFLRVKQAIEAYVPANMRSQTFELDSNIVFLDAYNANPTSMKMALKSFVNMKLKDEQVAVLGDMLELGAFSEEYHREILDMVSQMNFSQVWLVGDLFCKVDADGRYLHFNKIDEVANWLAQNPKTNTAFFVKGSRGIRLEQAFVKA
jgi:UDP-N-acetylmuramoyl-tripeptide--D-alanyl-D-alanine ligase